MGGTALTVAVGFASGVLSGAFGIGGGLVTTPAIRLLLGYPALVAVGTPLPVIIPGALTGALSYGRRGLADLGAGLTIGAAGAATSIVGALMSARAGGPAVLLATAVLILWASGDLLLQARRDAATGPGTAGERHAGAAEADPALDAGGPARVPAAGASRLRLVAIGLVAGAYSGFFGLGGGFIVVPALTRFCGFSMKRAIGTSLIAVALLSVPGTLAHTALGHVDWLLAALLAAGVVPGALLGARLTSRTSDRAVRIAFALFLAAVGVWLAIAELGGLGR